MNEMKPEDVMRALECCDRGSSCVCDCDNCPYYRCDVPCKAKLHADAIALLREKDAEIERLSSRVSMLHEIELSYALQYGDAIDKDIARKQLRAEAITEFSQRLKAKKCHYTETENTFDFDGVTVEDIDQIEKEMKGN